MARLKNRRQSIIFFFFYKGASASGCEEIAIINVIFLTLTWHIARKENNENFIAHRLFILKGCTRWFG
jgi:hypothetical protein